MAQNKLTNSVHFASNCSNNEEIKIAKINTDENSSKIDKVLKHFENDENTFIKNKLGPSGDANSFIDNTGLRTIKMRLFIIETTHKGTA